MVEQSNPEANGTQRILLNQGTPTCLQAQQSPNKGDEGKGKKIGEKLHRTQLATAARLETCQVGKHKSEGRKGREEKNYSRKN